MSPAPAVYVHTRATRLVIALLELVSGASLPLILWLVLVVDDPPITPPVLVRFVVVLVLVPGLAARLFRHPLAGTVDLEGPDLVIRGRRQRIEVPCATITAVAPWTLPLPGPGLSLDMRSGRRLPFGLESVHLDAILAPLAAADVATAANARAHPTAVYARARLAGAATGGPLRQVAIKFVAFPLLPALVLFYTHQHIAYGGFWGQWVLESPGSWLTTLATHWLTVAIYCVIYASVWRGLAEAAAIAAARIAPAYATRVRRAAEIACLALYYGGVPALLVARYLA